HQHLRTKVIPPPQSKHLPYTTLFRSSLNRVIQEYGVNSFANRVITPEGEGDVADAARNIGIGQVFTDPASGFNEVHRIVVMLVDACGNRENVRVENNILGREANSGEQVVGALTDFSLTLESVSLTGLVKCHNHRSSAIVHTGAGFLQEVSFAFLEADGVDDGFTLDALQSSFDHLPLGGIHHDGDPGNIRLRGYQLEELLHDFSGFHHPFVHVDVDHLSTIFHLIAGNAQSFIKLFFLDQT